MNWRGDMEEALQAFQTVARLGGCAITGNDMTVEYQPAPHAQPRSLPIGMMAVYAFWGEGEWLKIGKAGPNSGPRYTSQHYNSGSARSTLAGHIIMCPKLSRLACRGAIAPGPWIKANTHRVNILIPAERPAELLSLLEAFLHLRLRPRYERKPSA